MARASSPARGRGSTWTGGGVRRSDTPAGRWPPAAGGGGGGRPPGPPLVAALPPAGGPRRRAGDGGTGPRWDAGRGRPLAEPPAPGWRRWRLVRRRRRVPTALTAARVLAPQDTPV